MRIWHHLQIVVLGAVLALAFLNFLEPLAALLHAWRDSYNSEYSQGVVVVPFALYVAWLRRRSVFTTPAHCDLRGLLLIGFACTLHLLGRLAAGVYASQVAFVLVVAGVGWTCWGMARLHHLALPIILLAASIPLPALVYSRLSMPLRLFASRIACWAAELLGVSVYREGAIIHLAGMSLGVWEACSGLHSLTALVVGAVLLGFLLCQRTLTRLLLCIAAIPVAITANVLRVTGTALLSDWHPAYAVGFYHAFSGWLLFIVGCAGLYGTAVALRRFAE